MKKRLVLTLVIVLAIAALAGCSSGVDIAGNRIQKQGDTVTIKGKDGEVTASAGGNLSWPKDKMGDLPELNAKIISVINTPQGVAVTSEGVSKSDYDSYIGKLKGQGYETAHEMAMESMIMFSGQKDDNSVSVQLHLEGDSGKGTCVVIYGIS